MTKLAYVFKVFCKYISFQIFFLERIYSSDRFVCVNIMKIGHNILVFKQDIHVYIYTYIFSVSFIFFIFFINV